MIRRKSVTNTTTAELFNDFLAEKQLRGVTDTYIENAKNRYHMFCKVVDIDYPSDITKDCINEFITAEKGRIKESSINSVISAMRTFFYWLMDEGYVERFKISLVKGQEKQMKFYTTEELAKLLEKPKRNASFKEWRTWAITSFIMGTGARAATVSEIHKEDIIGNEVYYRHLKNKSIAIIPLSPALVKDLRTFNRMWETDSQYVFCDKSGERLSTSGMRQAFIKYCDGRGIQYKGLHVLRNSFAREWVKNGGGVFQLQRILTHSTIDMTQRYVNLFSEDIRDDVEMFSPLDSISASNRKAVRRAR